MNGCDNSSSIDLGNGYHAYKIWHIERDSDRESYEQIRNQMNNLSSVWTPLYNTRREHILPHPQEQHCPELWTGNIIFIMSETDTEPSLLMGEYYRPPDQYGQKEEIHGLVPAGCNGFYERMGQRSQYIRTHGHVSALESANKTLKSNTGISWSDCTRSVPIGWYDDPGGDTIAHGVRFSVLRWIKSFNPKGTECLKSLFSIPISELKELCKNRSKLQINEKSILPVILNFDVYILNILSLPTTKEFISTMLSDEKKKKKNNKRRKY